MNINIPDDLEKLIGNLPFFIQDQLNQHSKKDKLLEIVLDLGRRPEARFNAESEYLSQKIISWQDIDYLTKQISKFSNDNRAGIERTLHRISCIRNRQFLITGLTCRVGRSIFGTISVIRDLLESEKSILILGKPGVGKTTVVREIARVLADELEKRVVIIDTSNEIAGDTDIPHSGIGRARRMQVAKPEFQHQIMIESVENHMPQVIIIDEIGTEFEVLAARTIAEKGVQLVGTTHGNCLENLIKNPTLSDLIGGIQHVTLSDEEAKRRGTQKSILERKSYPAFEIVIEINSQNFWTVHEDVKESIDLFLRNNSLTVQRRTFSLLQEIKIKLNRFSIRSKRLSFPNNLNWFFINKKNSINFTKLKSKTLIIYPYSLSNNLLKEILYKMGLNFSLTNDIKKATLIIGLKKYLKQNLKLIKFCKKKNLQIYSINQISYYQLNKLLFQLYKLD
jgi:stage III sporulation protein SpoIIIAA